MNKLILFTDGSVNAQTKIGYGACLVVIDRSRSIELLKTDVRVHRFEDTSSTKLEFQTLLWALGEIRSSASKITVYTDSQNILGLPSRRERLVQSDYHSKKKQRIKNFELYQEFFQITDRLDCEFIKVRGHQATYKKAEIDKIFTLVDRASRKALRNETR